MYETKDAAQCFDVASGNAMTAINLTTGTCSLRLYHSSESDTATILWCQAQERNNRSSENKYPSTSSSSTLQHWDHAQHLGT